MEFSIKCTKRGYVLIRVDGEYSQHAHIRSKKTCDLLIDLIKKGKMPRSKYLKGSCKRLLTEKEYESLVENDKPRYYNVGRKHA